MITNLKQLFEEAKGLGPKMIAVAAAHDKEVLMAIKGAQEMGMANAILVGDAPKIRAIGQELGMDMDKFEIIDEKNNPKAAYKAVELVSSGKAQVLMKGLLGTADLLRAVLDKEIGLRTGRVLSHVAVLEIEGFDRLIMITDGGMCTYPDLKQKVDIINNAVELAHALGNPLPKVACIAAVEVVNPDMQATIDAALLAKMSDRGQIKGCIVDGPFGLDNAVSEEAAEHKGIKSPVAGKADIILVHDIQVGNSLGKSLTYLSRSAKMAGLIVGAAAPVVLVSRADTHEAKLASIALGLVFDHNKKK